MANDQCEGHESRLALTGNGGGALASLAFLGGRVDQLQFFRHLPAHLLLDDFLQGNIRGAQVCRFDQQWPAEVASAGVKLAHASGHQVDEHIGIAHLGQGLSAQFAIHIYPLDWFTDRAWKSNVPGSGSNSKMRENQAKAGSPRPKMTQD